ncbi:hypothetical protein L9F63_005163, partial [Diploptera punctata]
TTTLHGASPHYAMKGRCMNHAVSRNTADNIAAISNHTSGVKRSDWLLRTIRCSLEGLYLTF